MKARHDAYEPTETPATRPPVTVATAGAEVVHIAVEVRYAVRPSELVPAAVSWRAMPAPVENGFGVTAMDFSAAGTKSSRVVPEIEPEVAVTGVVPTAIACARPVVASTVANVGVLNVHVALAVKSTLLPSKNVPFAMNCCIAPTGSLGFMGVTAIDIKLTTGGGVVVPPPPHPANERAMVATNRWALTASFVVD